MPSPVPAPADSARRRNRRRTLRAAVEPVCLEALETRRMFAVAPAVPGTLNGKVVFAHAGHGYVWRGGTTWGVMRSYVNGMMEDHGNVDQLNFFAEHLLAAGATVVPLRPVGQQTNEVIVDNAGAGFSIQSGTWAANSDGTYWSNNNGNDGSNKYQLATTALTETAVARFTPNIPATGFYPVYAFANPGLTDNRVEDQIYRINYSGGSKDVKVATRLVGNGWIYLGNYYFTAGSSGNVEVSNKSATAGKVVVADAIRFGNGMGDYDPDGAGAAGVSGQPREEECSLYWCYQSRGWTGPGARVNDNEIDSGSTTLTHEEMNFTAPAKWSEYMNNSAFGALRDRVYLAFHSDASSNLSARGTAGLITGDDTPNQVAFADMAGEMMEVEMTALNSTHEFAWGTRGNTVTGGYGEIGNGNLGGEMDGTIIEVAFHTNTSDVALMKSPVVRSDVGRTAVHIITKYFDTYDIPWVNNGYAPEPPSNVRATTSTTAGQVTISWAAGASSSGATGPYGNAATGYRVWTSTNGYGFDLAATLGNVTSTTLSGLSTSAVTYFMVTAINAAGESLRSWTVAAKPQTGRRAPILIVNNYARLDRQGDKIESEYFGTIARVFLRHNNTFDYTVLAGEAIEAYNPALGIETATDDAIASGAISLSNYHTVIWMSGEQSTSDETFSATLQPLVSSYLSAGGKLFVSGAEVAWDLFGQSGETAADQAFLANQLHSTYLGDDAGTYLTSAGTGALAGVPALDFDDGTHGTYDADFADILGAGSNAQIAMSYSTGAANGAVIQWTGSGASSLTTPKVINMGFPFESIYVASQRNALMSAVLTYFGTNQTILTTTPTGVDMLATSDSGQSNTDNRTTRNGSAAAPLEFQVTGTIVGATVRLYFGNTLIGTKLATSATTDFLVNTFSLSGAQTLAATQQETGKAESLKTTGFTLTVDTTPLPVPDAPTIDATSTSSITLDWIDVIGTDVWGYHIYRSSTSGGPYTKLNGATPFAASTYVDSTVTTGQTYYYVTRSVDIAGNESADSGQSQPATAQDPSTQPGVPDLVAAYDSGWDDTDNYTNFNNSTPAKVLVFTVGNTVPGATLELYAGATVIASMLVTDTTTTITTNGNTLMTQGFNQINAAQTEPGKNRRFSLGLAVTVDVTAPAAPGTPDLAAGSDSGSSNADNYTNDATPTFTINGESVSRPILLVGGVETTSGFTGTGTFSVTPIAGLAEGGLAISARMVDRAGNVGNASAALNITIDTQAPAAPSAPDLRSDTDSGVSDNDDLTNVSTPSFTGTTETGSTVNILINDTVRGTGTAVGATYNLAAGPLVAGDNAVTAVATDLAGNASAPSSAMSITLDAVTPSATLGNETPSRGANTLDFTVTYTDAASLIDASTLGNDDVTVVGPDNTVYAATLIDAGTGGASRTVTYRINAPGGTWDSTDAGSYSVVQTAGGVADTAGNFRPAGAIGSINGTLPFAYRVGTTLHVDFIAPGNDVELELDGGNLLVTQGTTLSFATADFDTVIVHGTAGDDALQFNGPIAEPITFDGGAGNDSLDVLAGTFTFASDTVDNNDALAVSVAAGANVVFDATQHLRDLNVDGTATLTQGGGKVIVTRGLSGAGRLDLTDNDLVLDYDPNDPPTLLDQLELRIAQGANGGAWDGSGIATSMPDAAAGLTSLGIAQASDVFGLESTETADFSGETVDATAILIKYTYAGDANLDGQVTGDDYSAIDFAIAIPGATGWYNGDFNHDGLITGDDYSAIDFNIVAQDGLL